MMKTIRLPMVLLLAVVALGAFAQGGAETTSAPVGSLDDLEYLLEPDALRVFLSEPTTDYILVDVRTPEEYIAGHIPTAIQIDYREIGQAPPTADKDAFIVVYCRSGNRSNSAATTLTDLGYTRVLDWGGIIDWPYDVVTGPDAGQPM